MLGVAFPDDQVQILAYNRVISDLAGLTPRAFLDAVKAALPVAPGGAVPARAGDVSMFVDNTWYTVTLAHDGGAPGDVIGRLDLSLLQNRLLAPILKVADQRTDKRIDFVGGGRGIAALERLVGEGKAAVAFSLYPVQIGDVMAVSDAGDIMPPKSTWFEPKLRDGLLIHRI